MNATATDHGLSGWWRRVWAQIIDALIVVVIAVVLIAVGFSAGTAVGVVLIIVFIFSYFAYFVIGHGSRSGQTLGKKVLGIAVKGDIAYARISYARAFGRLLALIVLGWIPLVNLLNLLWPLWDGENQALHDKLADTVVVQVR
jgi:uncharacterized RDD family membrane protein YckC